MTIVKATAVYLLVVGLIVGWIYWAVVASEQNEFYGRLVWMSPLLLIGLAGLFHLVVILPIGWLTTLFGGNK
jgi:hypothetical protein